MKIKLAVFSVFLLAIIVTSGFGLSMVSKMSSIYAQVPAINNNFRPNGHPTSPVSTCTTVEVPISGSTLKATYTVPQGFNGNPATFNGKCVVDHNTSQQCTIVNGIATAGHCESVVKGYQVTARGPANLPSIAWHHLAGVTLKPGQFLDLEDTTPFITTKGHSATVFPCDSTGQPLVRLYAGIIDAGVNTLQSPDPEYLQQLSSPQTGLCVYHFDVGTTTNNPDGVTDFAIINTSNQAVTLNDRNTATLSVTEGYENTSG
ncbi:MAG TPA: hypothetical protein VIY08_10055 [Candidatus Nitrosocosmicus sp.]